MRTHQTEGVGCHLLAVISARPGLQVEVGEPAWDDGIRRAGEIEHLHPAVVLAGKHSLAAGDRPDHRDGPRNSGDLVGRQLVSDHEAFFETEQLGAERSIKQRASLSGGAGHGIALVTRANRQLRQV